VANVIVGCRLPNGLQIEHKGVKVHLNGLNKTKIIGATHATTEVDKDFWDGWKAEYKDFEPLKNGAIFAASGERDAEAKAKELKDEKTGFEPMSKESKAIKPADKA
jgi:hypothetical protein